jgi:hypothetical protein
MAAARSRQPDARELMTAVPSHPLSPASICYYALAIWFFKAVARVEAAQGQSQPEESNAKTSGTSRCRAF